ncbi:hypothetical protein I5677_09080 [Mobilitalea sibirica]|uniref:Uncharacterized protein n=1 Tax=Mobilitalea sibirica TaxID=1462919 RepID=A0A8J7KZV5_9FIRM|nr:hypothetical protein [Mobilitalea sibirica]MBH1941043.1 hypothetical protein [Mobilitalea sibirica]
MGKSKENNTEKKSEAKLQYGDPSTVIGIPSDVPTYGHDKFIKGKRNAEKLTRIFRV